MTREDGIQEALIQARFALDAGEVPVGAALFCGDTLLFSDRNRMREHDDPASHAEMLVLCAAQQAGTDLSDCTLYVTMEPCAMCAGAMLHYRLGCLVFGAFDERCGCCGSVFDLTDHVFYHSIETWGGVLEERCVAILQEFFSKKRCNSNGNPLY